MLKKKLNQFISDNFDIPLEGILDIPSAQIMGDTQLNIDGCIGIKKYETGEIIIRCKHHQLKILGEELSMLTFSCGRVSIRGKIFNYQIERL